MEPPTSIGIPPVLRDGKQVAVDAIGEEVTRVADRVEMATNHPAAEVAEEVEEEACQFRPGGLIIKLRLLRRREKGTRSRRFPSKSFERSRQ